MNLWNSSLNHYKKIIFLNCQFYVKRISCIAPHVDIEKDPLDVSCQKIIFQLADFLFQPRIKNLIGVDIKDSLNRWNSRLSDNKKLISYRLPDSRKIIWQFEGN